MLRSRKYIDYGDEEILEMSLRQLSERDMYFVLREIDCRGLDEEYSRAREKMKKRNFRESWGKYPLLKLVFLVFMAGFLVRRFMGSF